jgi:uncharacterized repeat protein (TIGR01451 family)
MRSHLIQWALLVGIGMGLAIAVEAEAQDARTNRSNSLINQLDQFGRSLFGGLRPGHDKPPAQKPVAQPQSSAAAAAPAQGGGTVRVSPQGHPSASRGFAIETGTSVRMHHAPAGPPNVAAANPATLPSPNAAVPAQSQYSSLPSSEASGDQGATPVPGSMRLHERLSAFRQSAFDDETATGDTATAVPASVPASSGAHQPSASASSAATYGASSGLRQPYASSQSPIAAPTSQPAVAQPAYTQRYSQPTAKEPRSTEPTFAPRTTGMPTLAPRLAEKPAPASSPSSLSRMEKNMEKKPSTPATAFGGSSKLSDASKSTSLEPSDLDEPDVDQAPSRPRPAPLRDRETASSGTKGTQVVTSPAPATKGSRPSADDSADALFSRQGPVLSVKTLGPRRITVGKESSYELLIRNSGQVAADEVVVSVDLPEWAEVMGTETTIGEIDASTDFQAPKQLTWKIARLEAKAQEKLILRLVPRQSRPFDLAVRWDYRPVALEAMIEVQEPKLEMRLEGPREVLFGKREVYRLELANTGTGEAEGVEISLLPIGTGENIPATHRLGTLAAGEKKVIEVELTARQAGVLTIKVDARGDGGVEASLAETIAVLRAALSVAVDAPRMQFVGNEGRYQIRVSNTGTAPATNLRLAARLPLGTKYVSSTGDGKLTAERGELTWNIASLPPGTTKDIEVVTSLERQGTNRLEVSAMADGELAASAESIMQVEAMADLRLDVVDPSGPVAVGDEAVYQIIVRNQGSKAAEDVEVIAYFSRGVEPTTVEGGPHKLAPGQVVFDKFPVLAAGQSVSLKIRAKADSGGNHVFRAEVYCRPLDTKLASEETTYYYGSSGGFENRTLHAGSAASGGVSDRMADRRQPGLPASSGATSEGSSPPRFNNMRSSPNPLQ